MLTAATRGILSDARQRGWVLEPDAKQIMREAGLAVPAFRYAKNLAQARAAAEDLGYPLVAKVVSPAVLHKTEVGGVAVGIADEETLRSAYDRFSRIDGFAGVLIEQMAGGLELIVGAKVDYQFGPVILLGVGGTGVEIYQDVTIRMAPLAAADVGSMVRSLKGRRLIEGFRGGTAVDMPALTDTLLAFSALVMEMQEWIASIDLNPVLCGGDGCVVADARILLRP